MTVSWKDILKSPSFNWLKKFESTGKGTSCAGISWTGLILTVRGRWISPSERKQRKAAVSEAATEAAEDTSAA